MMDHNLLKLVRSVLFYLPSQVDELLWGRSYLPASYDHDALLTSPEGAAYKRQDVLQQARKVLLAKSIMGPHR